nr:hypothetical protein Itr_chr06CG11630 [Ipomoea trifida]
MDYNELGTLELLGIPPTHRFGHNRRPTVEERSVEVGNSVEAVVDSEAEEGVRSNPQCRF